MATRSREILRKVDNDAEGGRQGCLPPAKEAHSPSRTLSAIKKPTTACSWKFSANPSIQTHETKEGEHSKAELECSALYNGSGDSEPAAPGMKYGGIRTEFRRKPREYGQNTGLNEGKMQDSDQTESGVAGLGATATSIFAATTPIFAATTPIFAATMPIFAAAPSIFPSIAKILASTAWRPNTMVSCLAPGGNTITRQKVYTCGAGIGRGAKEKPRRLISGMIRSSIGQLLCQVALSTLMVHGIRDALWFYLDDDDDMPDLQDMSGSENEEDEEDTEAINAAYEHTKALRDADRVAMKTRPKADLTKDIQPIFKEEEVPDSDIGVLVKGHWCLLCQKNGLPQKKCFLTGNVSLRRTHISRNPGHFAVYRRMCEKNNVPLHHQAIPKDFSVEEDPKQTTLDNFANKTPPFSCQGFLDYLVEMMVTEDDGFMLVDKGPFRRLLRYCRPSLKESDIPHRTKMPEEILQRAKDAEDQLRSELFYLSW
ncbi:hypothetical protein B0H14DRAFT_2626013 [Mycena olivaceomarginata]|nr:hypothetical protein B0H14DRAFT_2626013 [Mycena olivaceomarginata]